MANVKQAVGNVLDTVVGTSNALCTTVGLIGQTSQYASNFMNDLLKKQVITLAVDKAIFKQAYADLKKQELANSRIVIEEWTAKSPRHKELFDQAGLLIDQAIAEAEKAGSE